MNQDKPKRMFPDFKDYCNHSRIERMKDQEKKEAMNQDKQIGEKFLAKKKFVNQMFRESITVDDAEEYAQIVFIEKMAEISYKNDDVHRFPYYQALLNEKVKQHKLIKP